ncbi:MAG: hypothetical protein ACD_59C00070G0002 [uncultured bacterium]|nr:MAG: hypothetical protein ACD_59C00070G0002 [uncultured bacterium]
MSFFHSGNPIHFFCVNFLKTFKEKKKVISTLFLVSLSILVLFNFCAPSFSTENVQLPDLSKIRPFSADANYMSLEGFVTSYCRINYGMDLSRGEARRMVKENFKKLKIVTEIKSMTKLEPVKQVQDTKLDKQVKEKLIEIRSRHIARIESEHVKLSELSDKKIVLLPFKNLSKIKDEPEDMVFHYTTKYFKDRGYEVIDVKKENPNMDFNGLTAEKISKLGKKYGANYVVSGEIKHYRRYKRFRFWGFMLDYANTSVHKFADVSLKTKILKVSQNEYVYSNNVYQHKKRQVGGIIGNTYGLMTYTVSAAVTKLFNKFN